ncbi:hypothetical protein NHJ13051_009564 [Beauveria bassiana]
MSADSAVGNAATGEDGAPSTPLMQSYNCIVNVTDGVDDTVEAFLVKLQPTDIDDEKLSDLRSLIVKRTRCVEILQLPFCLASGAVVQDSLSVDYYLNTCLQTDASDGTIEVYLKDAKRPAEAAWNSLVPMYYSSQLTGTNAKHISELEEKQWNVVVETNQLCYGTNAVTQKIKKKVGEKEKEETVVVAVERAKSPAFRLAMRKVLSDTLASSIVKDVELDLRIPRYINDDRSYVSIRYSTTAAEKSLAKHGFTQTDISASGGGGAFGFSVEASASYSTSKESSTESHTANTKSDVTMSYNFPRVTVFLDEAGLELTPQCEADLKEIRDAASYHKFLKKYGEFFSSTIQLGGELFATETSEANTNASREATARSMKAAAAVAMSGWGFSASVSASHQNQSSNASEESQSASSRALIWQSNGGNTLLCNEPAAWAPSVAYYGNWRILKQGNVVRLMDVISKLQGFEYVRANLAIWKSTRPVADPPIAQKFTLNIQSAVRARYLRGRSSYYNYGEVRIGPNPETRTVKHLAWELVSAKGGGAVSKVEYGVDYYLLHRQSMLYPSVYDLSRDPEYYEVNYHYSGISGMKKTAVAGSDLAPVHMVSGERTRDYTVRFNDKDGNAKIGGVENGDTVTLEFSQASGAIGHLAEFSSAKNGSKLVVTKRKDAYAAVKMTYTEVAESDLQAASAADAKEGKGNESSGNETDDAEDEEL